MFNVGNNFQMLNNALQNPQMLDEFKKFVEENKDLSPEDICKKFNINPAILNLLK